MYCKRFFTRSAVWIKPVRLYCACATPDEERNFIPFYFIFIIRFFFSFFKRVYLTQEFPPFFSFFAFWDYVSSDFHVSKSRLQSFLQLSVWYINERGQFFVRCVSAWLATWDATPRVLMQWNNKQRERDNLWRSLYYLFRHQRCEYKWKKRLISPLAFRHWSCASLWLHYTQTSWWNSPLKNEKIKTC
jgi:hypothetical protein